MRHMKTQNDRQTIDPQTVVAVVDDDDLVRGAVTDLFRSVGLQTKAFSSVDEFLQWSLHGQANCLVLDVRMQGSSGLDLQAELNRVNVRIPVVFMSGHGDIQMSVRAIKNGAVDFLVKPFRDQDMIDAVQAGLQRDRQQRKIASDFARLKSTYDSLTSREQQVMEFVTAGLANKQIAGKIGVSEVTVKFHRGNVMRKMDARSIADLVRMADTLGVSRRVN